MRIIDALCLKEREIISIVGGGGKTSLMFRLAKEISVQYNVIITTTTKIFMPSPEEFPLVLLGEGEAAEHNLACYLRSGLKPVVGSGLLSNNKLKGITPEQVSLLQYYANYTLVEADGSKGCSLKGHLNYEPVIPGETTLLVVVVGADIIGKTLDSRHVHRPEIVARRTGRTIGSKIDAELVAELITHPEELLRDTPPGARIVVFINKADCLADITEVNHLVRLLLGQKIEKVILGSAQGRIPIHNIFKFCGDTRALGNNYKTTAIS
ncbi:selenium cofactor biosynthesis protein YqeC [Pelotomaculum propionicicum]|uniref:Selenium-dependent hydroxylase accessory protein YqeC n=1 Tax=Pelotomaculum propionicicum TaxID=258475 RepID=A0A4Y7RUK7_9FIRM|nr:selenium cofactor biosynthesis protein YqeC [Pelotomaculum propionicicum]NLI12751.1 putative selenium-dependent hydroxylase accessory protein YqeC [Peptococcaceae bacterium]TEB12419.1 hypothetical protein Pmgp_01036 [Pelotomaculum propionicicum]